MSSSLLDQVLEDDRWFSDGTPHWEGAPTEVDAIKWRCLAIKRLRASGGADQLTLADQLNVCGSRQSRPGGHGKSRYRRCGSPACPECARAIQRWFVAQAAGVVERARLAGRSNLFALHIVPHWGTQASLRLSTKRLARYRRRLYYALQKVGIDCVVIGGIDLSFNEYEGGHLAPVWQLHFHLLVITDATSLPTVRLADLFPKTQHIPKPIAITVHDGSAYGLSYLLKPTAWRKLYFEDRHRSPQDRLPLKPRQHVHLMTQLAKVSQRDRLFLMSVRIRQGRESEALISLLNREKYHS